MVDLEPFWDAEDEAGGILAAGALADAGLLRPKPILKVVSGGQTGADRAGLDAAKACGLVTGGWATKGYLIQTPQGKNVPDLSLKELGLVEMPSAAYPARTKQNVIDSDATVWFGHSDSPGGRLTLGTAKRLKKPYTINPAQPGRFAQWLGDHNVDVLNVAGNRLSDYNPTIYDTTYRFLVEVFRQLAA